MSSPLRGLKYLPWASLFQASFLTVLIVTVLDWLLIRFGTNVGLIREAIALLYSGVLSIVVGFAVAFCLGALAVWLLDRVFKQSITTDANLWGLLLCLILVLIIKSWFIPGFLLDSQQVAIIGAVFGVFLSRQSFAR
ncbi:MAG: peptide chain release factor 1 [Elainellaceae cyanobacterium]